ncbi:MAG: UDP-N-acetylmuramoyl-L-alanyl-D-glutamate--2,6-diaminopimelate ligase [Planctomycetota bacterium]|nr:UDP-N-acetylmuramoyl-L-alanyl-D-glutamate--2,6-diaminopimelate ligase [Planctomycetota bacterium]
MLLGELCKDVTAIPAECGSLEISEVVCDSREAVPGCLFIAVPGETTDGLLYAAEAVEKGAAVVVAPREADGKALGVPVLAVDDVRSAMGKIADRFYGEPSRELEIVGVTGTKGKTTTVWLLDQLFSATGDLTGFCSTVENRIGDDSYEAKNTTAGCLDLHRFLAEVVERGGKRAVIEVSSHALEQQRTASIRFDCAVFTNLAPEHLDYHEDMESYLAAKMKLFSGLDSHAYAVLPRSQEASLALRDNTQANIAWYGCGLEDGTTGLRMDKGIEFTWRDCQFRVGFWGEHNLENLLAVLSAGECMGLRPAEMAALVSEIELPPGRLEQVHHDGDYRVVVDYAHTDGALEAVLSALRPVTPGRLITIFGCGGDRDTAKRPRMGKVAEDGSDRIILTSDNPRSEAPKKILDEIMDGIEHKDDVTLEEDRRAAIALGIRMASPGDTVLIAGKGHEDYQEFSNRERIHFDDREVAEEFLKEVCSA